MGKYKVMVTYVEAGMGHIISAEAIANALETYYPDEVEVERCHILQETDDPYLKKHEQFLIAWVKKSNRYPIAFFLLMFLQKLLPPQMSIKMAYSLVFRKEKRRMINIMKKSDPDMVFHTHFTPLHCAIEANKKKWGGNFLTGVYVPDPNAHNWWDKRTDLLLVNNLIAYNDAVNKNGTDPDKVVLSRFILRSDVRNTTKDKETLRAKHGLPADQFTVVMAAGAYAEGHLQEFADRFLQIDRKFTLLVIAGTNDEVYEHFNALVGNTGKVDLRVYHFVKEAHELYGASNLFVTKAGPNAILDSVYMDTPVMTNFYASPIERITKDLYVTTHKTGVHTEDPDEAARLLTSYIDDPALLDPYVENCRAFIRDCTGGEKEMADAIVGLLRKNGQPKADRK